MKKSNSSQSWEELTFANNFLRPKHSFGRGRLYVVDFLIKPGPVLQFLIGLQLIKIFPFVHDEMPPFRFQCHFFIISVRPGSFKRSGRFFDPGSDAFLIRAQSAWFCVYPIPISVVTVRTKLRLL